MDSLDNLIDKFDSMKNTHPNLSKIWIEYLKIKQERIENIIQQGEITLQQFETTDDLQVITISLLNELATTLP